MAALVVRKVADSENVIGKLRSVFVDVTFSSSYPTGGEVISPAKIGLKTILGGAVAGNNSGYYITYDSTNKKLIAFVGSGASHTHSILFKNAAVADGATTRVNVGTNLLGANTGGDLTVAGGGANGGVVAATPTAAAAAQVTAAVDLSAVTVRVYFVGR